MQYLHIALFSIWASLFNFLNAPQTAELNRNPLTAPMPMCHNSNMDPMAVFASDPAFWALHPSPLPLNYNAMGTMMKFKVDGGADANAYIVKAKKKSKKWLFVYQEWWGLNEYIKRQSDTFYKDLGEDVNVLAVDMYDGQSTSDPAEAMKLIQGVKEERLVSIVNGAVKYAGKKAKIANVGWCFGGGWSLRSAIQGGKHTIGCVMYYGMPVKDVDQLKTLNCNVLGLFATEERISKQVIEEFAANMRTAGKGLDYKIFNGVHGFANPSNPKYDETLSKEAYGMALTYLKKSYK